MAEKVEVSDLIPTTPKRLYEAWLDSAEHSAFTGSKAKIDPRVNGKFSAWDRYITGTTLELEPHRRIVQSWRTTDFPEKSEDSRLEILIAPSGGKARITLRHSNIPDGQGEDYRQGWKDSYFEPMKAYFASFPGKED